MVSTAASVRAFGRAEDLDVPFEGTDRPRLVSTLLARCSVDPEVDWWEQRVGDRIAALLRLVALSDGIDALPVVLRCPQAACGSDIEIALPLDALDIAAPADPIAVGLADGRHLTVRRPTGVDQRRWNATRYESRRHAVTAIVHALVVDGEVAMDDEPALGAVAAALAEGDPLVDFSVSCVCPACMQAADIPIDLEKLALSRLAAMRRALTGEVHALASAYGWTEAEILAIPRERRARYRALIDGGAS
jgi:hypothetical protein